MKSGWVWVAALIILIVIVYLIYKNKQDSETERISKTVSIDGKEKILTYRLPTSLDTEVFGPHYWAALHNIVDEIPCSICRNDAIGLMESMHNVVNYKLDKPIYKEEKFDKYLEYMSEIKENRDKMKLAKKV